MNIKNRDDLIALLNEAKDKGALISVDDISMRNIMIESADGSRFRIEWYNNLCTLKCPGFSMWFTEIVLSSTHPSFEVELHLYYEGVITGHIGKVYDHLLSSFSV